MTKQSVADITIANGTAQVEILKRRRLTSIIRRLAWLNWKLTLAAWGVTIMLVPPAPVIGVQGVGHYIWTSMAVLGALISCVGICISFSRDPLVIRRRAVPVELTGLCMMFIGPLSYFITQVSLLSANYEDEYQNRLALTIFAWAMVGAVIARGSMVIPRFHKEK